MSECVIGMWCVTAATAEQSRDRKGAVLLDSEQPLPYRRGSAKVSRPLAEECRGRK